MAKVVECVPNFSEGRDSAVIEAIAQSVRRVAGVTLLNVDPGKSTNRTVFTFVGDPDAIVEAAFQAAKKGYELIDMRTHQGAHPRMGAVDVVPFVPVSDVSMAECAECSRTFGRRVGEELGIPVYLYEEAQDQPHRKALRQIRSGEYEGIEQKVTKPEWRPDFGPAEFVPASGATVTGARFFLIAYNVNILGTRNQAHRIALNIREQGRGPDEPGRLQALKGIGWYLEQYELAQVSMNLDNYHVTPIHRVFEEVKRDAAALNVAVAGSEIVGLVPLEAILMAADYYIDRENLLITDQRAKIRLVIERLGLSSITAFKPEERIIEYMIEQPGGRLVDLTVAEFVSALAARSATPGGGSVSALVGAMGAALGAMVGWLTYGRRKYEHLDKRIRKAIPPLEEIRKELIRMVDRDTDAYTEYMNAVGLPKATAEEQAARQTAMQQGLKSATLVPFRTMELADSAWDHILTVARIGQYSSASDVEVGARALETAVYGAYRNVMINVPSVQDDEFKRDIVARAGTIHARAVHKMKQLQRIVAERTGDV
ncbi:MAG: glutamate formimidoyltransferase [Spirochaetaceae bacterium]|nr:MAG: glutamate formimidoyltransferase [Spirochaetaceae bacterium]